MGEPFEMITVNTLPQWDLNDLYPGIDSDAFKQDIHEIQDRVRRFQKLFQGQVSELESDVLASAIEEYEAIEESLGKLSSYAQLVFAQNMSDPARSSFYQNTSEKIVQISSDCLFFELELNRLSETAMAAHLQHDSVAHYAPWLRDVRIMKDYQLSDEVEKILHEKSITSKQSWCRLFEETIADMRFDLNGTQLTCSEILNNLSSPDKKLRKASAQCFGQTLAKQSKTFAFITNTLAKDKAVEDNKRGFQRPISSRNLSNLIEDEVTDALIGTVKDNYANISHRYYALKAKWFGVKKLHYWDRNAPLPGEPKQDIPWDSAVEMVLDAYAAFSPEMATIGNMFFDKNWIDAMPVEGKDSGAFSHPTVPSAHPYILMNYHGKTRDVMTLAHELGHGIHQVLSAEQGALMADTPLTLAETASVFGEQLTFRSMLKNIQSDEQRRFLIAGKVEDMLNTVVRQIAFCDFEIQLHDARAKGELSIQDINNIWLKVQRESLGESIKFHDEYAYFWSYIPHFIHTPFYVYAYAFGDCLVNSLYRVYEQQPDGFVDKYLTMLRAGGTLRHQELLAPFGLDATQPDFWQQGLSMIAGFIDELEAM